MVLDAALQADQKCSGKKADSCSCSYSRAGLVTENCGASDQPRWQSAL